MIASFLNARASYLALGLLCCLALGLLCYLALGLLCYLALGLRLLCCRISPLGTAWSQGMPKSNTMKIGQGIKQKAR